MATETYVLNESLDEPSLEASVNFISNNQSFNSMNFDTIRGYYGTTKVWETAWVNEAYRTIVLEAPATGNLLTWLQANATKQATPRLSVDLTTLAGWANLSAGSHDITIVAKAAGYKDSAPSAAVQVTKAAATKTLKAGTYKWKDAPTLQLFNETIAFTSGGSNWTGLTVNPNKGGQILYIGTQGEHIAYGALGWGDESDKTITLATDQQVSADFYEWAITGGNLVEQPAMPVKGDIITLDSKQYRVLKTEGTVAEVLAMYSASTSVKFDSASSGYNNTYAGKSLDTYCNSTFYSGLSAAMQNAIVAKTFQQDSWKWNGGSSAIANYAGTYGDSNYTLSLMSTTFGSSISRKCYVLSVQDVIDYLGVTTSMGSADTTLTSENVWKMFWNQTTSPGSTHPWLRSAFAGDSLYAFDVYGGSGRLDYSSVGSSSAVRPAFQIDLSKISWS